jgi:DNA (cytosine-5)-methyltransferase 1
MPSSRKYDVVSLFSGAMGLDVGLEQTGRFRVLACVEKEPAFCETIRANRDAGRLDKNLRVFQRDVGSLDPLQVLRAIGKEPGEVDLLVGGPPCQSFSTAGRRGTVQDHRGTLLWQFLRFIEAIRPRFFLMENVRGLLSAAIHHRKIAARADSPLSPEEEPGSVVRSFAADLQSIKGSDYHMDCFEVNAVNYGAPQLRERALFIGNRYNDVVNFPDPSHGSPASSDAMSQAGLFDAPILLPWRTLGEALANLTDASPVIMDFSPRKKSFLAHVPPGSNWRSLPLEMQQESMGQAWFAKGGRSGWWRRLSFDLPCPTLVTMPNHASTALCHPVELRALSIREYARIQEFPEEWRICGTPAEQYAQIGNAVPVRLGLVAGKVIAEHLDKLAKSNWQLVSRETPPYRVVYVQSHVRTRQWFKDGETFVWKDGDTDNRPHYGGPKTKRKSALMQVGATGGTED